MARARTTRSAPNTRASRAAVPAVARTKPVNAERAPSGFDLLLLTVANDVQRRYAEQMLEIRKSLGTLPRGLATLVMADPAGKRIGSGGSTLLCMAELAKRGLLGMRGARILILHSGGDSRRLPSWSAPGKIWVPLGRTGRADSAATTDTAHRGLGPFNVPTLFDLILAELSRLTLPTSGGVLVASGDAALRLADEHITFSTTGATVLAFPAGPDRAARHGVFVLDKHKRVVSTLQKPSRALLHSSGALDANGHAAIDSGIFFFPTKACHALLRGASVNPQTGSAPAGSLLATLARGHTSLDLYQEIADAMSGNAERSTFVARFTAGGGASRTRMLGTFFTAVHTVVLYATLLNKGSFLHLGTTRELIERLSSTMPERMFPDLLTKRTHTGADSVLALETGADAKAPRGIARYAVPVGAAQHCWVLHGIDDDCKTTASDGGTVCGKPLATLEKQTGSTARALWGNAPHTLWNARIYPVGKPDDAWRAMQWILGNSRAPAAWQRMRKVSLAELMLLANPDALARGHIHAQAYAPWRPAALTPLDHAREFAARAEIAQSSTARTAARTAAMAAVGVAVARDAPMPREVRSFAVRQDQAVWASAPVRIDLAGGWSDTPPLCIEHGGSVVNAAVTLGGTLPLQVMVRVTDTPEITVHSVDSGRTGRYRSTRELLDHHDPAVWDALPRAALVLSGLVPRDPKANLRTHLERAGGGLAITLFSAVPRGSGLGTSSILGATMLATLDRVAGRTTDPEHVARNASLLEQMIQTRGGWQDQVGGLWGGIKLCTTHPGVHQVPHVAPIAAPPAFVRALHERAVLLYSGRRRMARDILETVVLRYLRGEHAVTDARARLVAGAHAMAEEIARGDVSAFAHRLSEYRELKRTVDPASVTPDIEATVRQLGNRVTAWSMAGAGGGGFLLILCRSASAAHSVRNQLESHPGHPLARPFAFELDPGGLRISVL